MRQHTLGKSAYQMSRVHHHNKTKLHHLKSDNEAAATSLMKYYMGTWNHLQPLLVLMQFSLQRFFFLSQHG